MNTLPDGFADRIRKLRSSHRLHTEVIKALLHIGTSAFPSWVFIGEVAQTPGGRNDGVLFEADGQSTCFEVFASSSQVDRDLLLLRDTSAQRKIAVLLDREIDPKVSAAYYRKRPASPYPVLWVSDLLVPERMASAQMKIMQYVLGGRIADALKVSHELNLTAKERILKSWARDGIDIIVGLDASNKPTFRQVFTLIAVSRLQKLGLPLHRCKAAARTVSESFEFIMQQIFLGVPMLLVSSEGDEWNVLDLSDYEALLMGGILQGGSEGIVMFLNPLYETLRSVYKGPLPTARKVDWFIEIMVAHRQAPPTRTVVSSKRRKKPTSSGAAPSDKSRPVVRATRRRPR